MRRIARWGVQSRRGFAVHLAGDCMAGAAGHNFLAWIDSHAHQTTRGWMGCVARKYSETNPVGHTAKTVVRLEGRVHFGRRMRGRCIPGYDCWRCAG